MLSRVPGVRELRRCWGGSRWKERGGGGEGGGGEGRGGGTLWWLITSGRGRAGA